MRMIPLIFGMVLTTAAHANPADAPDEMGQLLQTKGVLTQVQETGRNVSQKASELVLHAIGFLGVPYLRGGNNAESGFDCSGFVKAIYQQIMGQVLPRQAEQQAAATQKIDATQLQPGDLVFFNTMRRAYSHVGIYIGDGRFVHSPKPGAEVRIENMGLSYWRNRFDGARRIQALL